MNYLPKVSCEALTPACLYPLGSTDLNFHARIMFKIQVCHVFPYIVSFSAFKVVERFQGKKCTYLAVHIFSMN